jgi:type II secretion system protein G
MRARPSGGFTLIELLIVVAIIAILAAIAVPNFLEAQVRSKVSRVKSDMRTLATALETYRMDNTGYPTYDQYMGKIPDTDDFTETPVLSSPVAYITSLDGVAVDIFMKLGLNNDPAERHYNKYLYWSKTEGGQFSWYYDVGANAATMWALMSVGPDTRWYADPDRWPGSDGYNDRGATQYDASNGTISWGDISRFGP